MGKDIYELQKDLPDSKAGDKYIWINLLIDSGYYKNGDANESYWTKETVENNTEWFKKVEKAKATVNTLVNNSESINFYLSSYPTFIEIKKERLAELLIAESKSQLFIDLIP